VTLTRGIAVPVSVTLYSEGYGKFSSLHNEVTGGTLRKRIGTRIVLSIIGITALAFTAIGAIGPAAANVITVTSATVHGSTANPVVPSVPSDLDPNDGVTAGTVGADGVVALGEAVPGGIRELQRSESTRSCSPVDSRGVSVCIEDGKPDPRARAQVEARAQDQVEARTQAQSETPVADSSILRDCPRFG
jgi:hypothetical protein